MGCFDGIDEKELQKNSVFLLSYQQEKGEGKDAERDFEFFVFVDPENDNDRPDFLKELYHCLINLKWEEGKPKKPDKDNSFFDVPKHKEQLKKWLNIQDENDQLLTPLNWLKIAIERYPYRLFVVIDPKNWKDNRHSPLDENKTFWFEGDSPPSDPSKWKRSPFLYKRICWVGRREFERAIKGENSKFLSEYNEQLNKEEKFKLWLYVKWIKFLKEKICLEKKDIIIGKKLYDNKPSEVYNPKTLPKELQFDTDVYMRPKKDCKSISSFTIKSFESKIELSEDSQSSNLKQKNTLILYSRHKNAYEFSGGKWQKINKLKEINLLYSENLSGVLSYWNMLKTLEEQSEKDYIKIKFNLWLIENGLLNIAIIDERVQEKYLNLGNPHLGKILQTKLFPAFFDAPGLYGQRSNYSGYKITYSPDTYQLQIKSSDNDKLIKEFIGSSPRIDILIIHQGILDKAKNEKRIDRDFLLDLKDHMPFIIVTSGRGKTQEIPIEAKFIGFAEIQKCMLSDRFEKLILLLGLMRVVNDGKV